MTGTERAKDESWLNCEIADSEFQDIRLRKRFGMLLEQLWKGMGQTIPLACQDWANTKAAYRFMNNDRVSEQDILSGHFRTTSQRSSTTDGPILVLQDTTTFSYEREHPELIGYAGSAITSAQRRGRTKPSPQCGILMHSSLAVTTEG
ncbi:IS4/Tn5 family transposase DNA-binding protein, partial [Paraburkholderia podalyriae]